MYDIIVVIDDPCDNDTIMYCNHNGIRYLINSENMGFAKTCNRGVKEANTKYVILFNDDATVLPGWCESLLNFIKEKPMAAMVGMRLYFPGTKKIQHGGVEFFWDGNLSGFPYHICHQEEDIKDPRVFESKKSFVTAAVAIFNRDAFLSVGGLDETYYNNLEDIDVELSLIDNGWEIWYNADCVGHHPEAQSGDVRRKGIPNSMQYFQKKWSINKIKELYTKMQFNVKCPICNSDNPKRVFNSIPPIVNEYTNEWAICHCGVAFQTKYDTNFAFNGYEQDGITRRSNYMDKMQEETDLRWRFMNENPLSFDNKRSIMSTVMSNKGNVLEVAPNLGHFLKKAVDCGWIGEGIEFSKNAYEFAKEHFGLNVRNEDIMKSHIEKDYYNMICSFEFLEHCFNPIEFIEKCYTGLKKDGVLIMSTPNLESTSANFYGDRWLGYHCYHYIAFSFTKLKNVLENIGFEVFDIIENNLVGGYGGCMMIFARKK